MSTTTTRWIPLEEAEFAVHLLRDLGAAERSEFEDGAIQMVKLFITQRLEPFS